MRKPTLRVRLAVPLLGIAALVPVAASAGVTVTFAHPEHYTDALLYGGYGDKGRAPALRAIAQELQQLGQTYLPAGETLSVEILDVDLAGRLEPWHVQSSDTRYMRDVTWPRIKLRYRLEGAASPVAGEETVSDPMYLMHGTPRGESMPYEKAMLEDWFRARFVSPASPEG